jgi:ABC-type molybdate transport system substrate-binding protein
MEDAKIKIALKPIEIPRMIDLNLKELANKVNQIIFVLNEMGITIMKEDVLANAVWKKILEDNK